MLPAGYLSRAFMKDCDATRTNHILSVPDHQPNETQRDRFCDPALQRLKSTILDGVPDTKDDPPAVIHPSHSRRASTTPVSRRYIDLTTRQSHSGKTKNWQSLSVTPDKPQVLETRPLDLDGCQSHQVTCRTMHKYNRTTDCRPTSSLICRLRVQSHRVHMTDCKA